MIRIYQKHGILNNVIQEGLSWLTTEEIQCDLVEIGKIFILLLKFLFRFCAFPKFLPRL